MNLYAWLCDDRGRGPEIIAVMVPGMGSGVVPLVTSHEALAHHYRTFAEAHGKATGKPVKLVKFKDEATLDER